MPSCGACRNQAPRAPVELQQRCKDGSQRSVEASCYPLHLGRKSVLAVAVHDVTRAPQGREPSPGEAAAARPPRAPRPADRPAQPPVSWRRTCPMRIEEAQRDGSVLAVLFLDLDRFKHINDSRGHETGDKLLQDRRAAHPRDHARRGHRGAHGRRRIRRHHQGRAEHRAGQRGRRAASTRRCARPMIVDGRTLVTTVSIGVSLFPHDGADMGELLRHSDTAMYQAKDRGRNNFQLFSPGMDRRLKERIAIEAQPAHRAAERPARRALPADRRHRDRRRSWRSSRCCAGSIRLTATCARSASSTIAEETGLIVPIGEFVLRAGARGHGALAADAAARWCRSRSTSRRCSCSARILPTRSRGSPSSTAWSPAMLQLELTESAVFERREARAGEASQDAVRPAARPGRAHRHR